MFSNTFNKVKQGYGVGEWAAYSYNIGRGCVHNCLYCFACSDALKHNNIFNRSVLGDDAFYFETPEDIAAIINKQDSKEKYADIIQRNSAKIVSDYSWQKITNQLELLFKNALTNKS